MAFAQPYFGGYQPGYYQPPMPDQLAQLRQNQFQPIAQPVVQPPQMQQPQQNQPTSNGIIWCQGEEGAKGFLVAAGNSVMLMDSESSTFYIKSTDASGMPQPLRIFDYTERTATPKITAPANMPPNVEFATKAEVEALAARLDALTSKDTAKTTRKSVKEDTDNA